MAPPQLARHAPVLDIIQPLVIGRGPVFRHEFDLAAGDHSSAISAIDLPGKCVPSGAGLLIATNHWSVSIGSMHDAGAVAARHHQFVRLDFGQQALRVQVGDDLLARDEAVQSLVGGRRGIADLRVQREHADLRAACGVGRLHSR